MSKIANQDSLIARAKHGNTLSYLQKHRGSPQYRPPPSAARAVKKVLRPLSKKFGAGASGISALRKQWPNVMGARWAQLSTPTAVRGKLGAKTLYIEAKGPAAAMLQADSANVLRKINQFLGAGAIAKISVKQVRITPQQNPPKQAVPTPDKQQVQETLVNTDESTLQDALNRLGAKLEARERK